MSQIFVSLFPLLALIFAGYLLHHKKILADGFWSGAEKLNYYILFPAMLFSQLATADINLALVQSLMLILAMVFGIACIALYLIRAFYKTPAARFGVYMQSVVRFNTYIALAVVAALFHQPGMTILAICLAMSIPAVNIVSVVALTDPEQMNFVDVFKALIRNPLILSCIIGALFNASGLSLWVGLNHLLHQLAICSLPLGLLCVGAALQFNQFKAALWPLFINTFARLLIMPALAWLVCIYVFDVSPLVMQVVVIFFALPTASAAYILTKVLNGDSQLMAAVISLQTLCVAFTLPLVIWWVI